MVVAVAPVVVALVVVAAVVRPGPGFWSLTGVDGVPRVAVLAYPSSYVDVAAVRDVG